MLIEILKKRTKTRKKRQHIVDEKVFCKISIVKKLIRIDKGRLFDSVVEK